MFLDFSQVNARAKDINTDERQVLTRMYVSGVLSVLDTVSAAPARAINTYNTVMQSTVSGGSYQDLTPDNLKEVVNSTIDKDLLTLRQLIERLKGALLKTSGIVVPLVPSLPSITGIISDDLNIDGFIGIGPGIAITIDEKVFIKPSAFIAQMGIKWNISADKVDTNQHAYWLDLMLPIPVSGTNVSSALQVGTAYLVHIGSGNFAVSRKISGSFSAQQYAINFSNNTLTINGGQDYSGDPDAWYEIEKVGSGVACQTANTALPGSLGWLTARYWPSQDNADYSANNDHIIPAAGDVTLSAVLETALPSPSTLDDLYDALAEARFVQEP